MTLSGQLKARDRSWYGCNPDLVDERDRLFVPRQGISDIWAPIDLRIHCPPVMDQGSLGSCTAHGVTGVARYYIIQHMYADPQHGIYDFPMSRLQLYWWSRFVEGNVEYDSGAQIRDAIKVLAKHGVGHEDSWPYEISWFKIKPPKELEEDAMQYKALAYHRVDVRASEVKSALNAGHPVVIGVSVYESFEGPEVARNGIVPMPAPSEQLMGGHCMYVVGFKDGRFIVRNSWGTDWGDKGDCYLLPAYLERYGADFWVIDMFGSDAEKAAGTAA